MRPQIWKPIDILPGAAHRADRHARCGLIHKEGGFLPHVPLPRRMWAGGRVTFHDDL